MSGPNFFADFPRAKDADQCTIPRHPREPPAPSERKNKRGKRFVAPMERETIKCPKLLACAAQPPKRKWTKLAYEAFEDDSAGSSAFGG